MLSSLLVMASLLSPAIVQNEPAQANVKVAFGVQAKRVHLGDGSVLENALLIVEGTVITAIGTQAQLPAGAPLIEHNGDLAPGWIALHDQSGGDGELHDSARVALPGARTSLGLNSTHSDFAALRAAGITSIVLASPDRALVPGQTAVVKTAGGTIVRDPAQLQLSFSPGALEFGRFPTSIAGAVAELDERMQAAQGPFGQARRGELQVLIAANAKDEILRALDFAQRHQLKGALYGAPLAGELATQIANAGLAVVWQAFDVGLNTRDWKALAQLARAGVPFGFALDAPERHPESLRLSAAAAVRAGVVRESALRALTSGAAQIAGVKDRVGLLAVGLDADFVLWNGDPLDLQSSIQAVFVDGQRVHEGGK